MVPDPDSGGSNRQYGSNTSFGIAIGAGLGASLGVALGNFALGIAVGISVGGIVGTALDRLGRGRRTQAKPEVEGGGRRWLQLFAIVGLLIFLALGAAALFFVISSR